MTYSVKEIYFTLQGEGVQSGRPAVFCRFSGCNLWTGLEKDRDKAVCRFCDTEFVGTDGPGGGKFATPTALAATVAAIWVAEAEEGVPYVVCTGGEPLLQLDEELITAFKEEGFEVGVETNGTIAAPEGLDWICVSPKVDAQLVQKTGDELKLVYPQEGGAPERFAGLTFNHFLLQPMDGTERDSNTALAVDYCNANPQWKVSVQTHKLVGLA
jgi:7-carboxy-7-deazaguanine synthase